MAPPTKSNSNVITKSNVKVTTIELVGGIYCSTCQITYNNKKDYEDHYRQLHTFDNDIWYTCVVCRKDIHGYASFRGHCYTTHVIKNRFKCKTCFKCFSKQSVLDDHVATQHQFKCPPPCNKEFPTKKDLKLHQIVHKQSAGPPYDCQQCGEPIRSLDACQLHADRHARFTYTCPICSETFEGKPAAGQHLTKHFIGEILQINDVEEEGHEDECAIIATGGILCALCQSLHRSRADLDQHFEEMHEDEQPVYTCNCCGDEFPRFHLLAYHCYNHVAKRKFKCDTCQKPFPRLSLLVAHSRECDGSPRPFQCALCPAVYADESRRAQHVRAAHPALPALAHACPEPGCQQTFERRHDLLIHQMSHRGTDSWCRACGLEFKSLAACERHLDVHRRSLHACPVCRKHFAEKHQATKHISQHFSSVLHVCKTCGNIYNAKYRLAEHIKSHSDTKPFECTHCGKGFLVAAAYQQHLNTHTGDRPYKCVACEKAFKSYSAWSKHLRNMHDIDPKTAKKPDVPPLEPAAPMPPPPIDHTDQRNLHKCELCDKSFVCLRYWERHLQRTHNLDPKSVSKPELSSRTHHDGAGLSGEAVLENFSSDENIPEALEEAYMYLQSVESEGSQAVVGDVPAWTPEAEMIQQEVPLMASVTDQQHAYIYPVMMPESSGYVADPSHASQELAAVLPPDYPREYGPDFINCPGIPAPAYDGHVINLDDHLLPHIDPHLTINQELGEANFLENLPLVLDQTYGQDMQQQHLNAKWEPPIITKIYRNYYDQMTDISSNIMSVMTTDIY